MTRALPGGNVAQVRSNCDHQGGVAARDDLHVRAPGDDQPPHDPASPGIVTAWGRDFRDVSPLRGVIFTDATKSSLSVGVEVTRLDQ